MGGSKHINICEVGTRDGFQIESEFIPTEEKIEIVNRLSDTGLAKIEVTSFVHPKAIPPYTTYPSQNFYLIARHSHRQ